MFNLVTIPFCGVNESWVRFLDGSYETFLSGEWSETPLSYRLNMNNNYYYRFVKIVAVFQFTELFISHFRFLFSEQSIEPYRLQFM